MRAMVYAPPLLFFRSLAQGRNEVTTGATDISGTAMADHGNFV